MKKETKPKPNQDKPESKLYVTTVTLQTPFGQEGSWRRVFQK